MGESKKTAKIVWGALIVTVVIVVAYVLAAPVRSRVVVAERGKTIIFIDKYIPPDRRADFISRYPDVLAVIYATLDLPAESVVDRETTIFATKSDYAVLDAGDPLVTSHLAGRPSGDFRLFSVVAQGFFANELAADSCVSDDGHYIFLNADRNWDDALVHATAHSMANRALPAAVSMRVRHSGGTYDPALARKWRFADETVALFLSELLIAFGGPVNESNFDPNAFELRTKQRYAASGPLVTREEVEYAVTFKMPVKTVAYYRACHDFALSLVKRSGFAAMRTFLRNTMTGDWKTLDDLVSPFGSSFDALAAPYLTVADGGS